MDSTYSSTLTAADILAATKALPEPTAMSLVRCYMVHPDHVETLREKFPAPRDEKQNIWSDVFATEVVGMTHVPKDRALLCDKNRKPLGVMNLATGTCYFFGGSFNPFAFPPPNFNFA